MKKIFIFPRVIVPVFAILAMSLTACANTNSRRQVDTVSSTEFTASSAVSEEDTCVKTATLKKESRPKKVSILGDSYSTFEGYVPSNFISWYKPIPKKGRVTDVTDVDQTWWKIFIDKNGYELEQNNSYSGSTICNTGYGKKDYTDQSFVTRRTDLGNPDLILVFGGTNDSWADSPIGEYVWDGWTKQQLYAYRPATSYLLSELQKIYPNAEVVVLINDMVKPEITESTIEICNHYGVKYVQLHDIAKKSDHPDAKGMIQIVDQLEAVLQK